MLFMLLTVLASCDKSLNEIATEINTYDAIVGKWEQLSYKENESFIPKHDGSYYKFSSNWTFETYDADRKSFSSGSFLYNPDTKSLRCIHQDKTVFIYVEYTGANEAMFTIVDTKLIIKVRRNGS